MKDTVNRDLTMARRIAIVFYLSNVYDNNRTVNAFYIEVSNN